MSSAAHIAGQIHRRRSEELERLADEITERYTNREFQCQTAPFEKRGPKIRRVPQTALIARAAQRAIVRRQLKQIVKWAVEHSPDPPYIRREDYSQTINFVGKVLERLSSVEHGP